MIAIASLASALISGISSYASSKNAQQQQENYLEFLKSRKAAQDSRIESKIQQLENEDPLNTKTGSALAENARERLAEENEKQAGRDAVMGNSGINAAKQKKISSDILADTYRNIVMSHEANVASRIGNLEMAREDVQTAYNANVGNNYLSRINASGQAASAGAQGVVGALNTFGNLYMQNGGQNGAGASGNGTKNGVQNGGGRSWYQPPGNDNGGWA